MAEAPPPRVSDILQPILSPPRSAVNTLPTQANQRPEFVGGPDKFALAAAAAVWAEQKPDCADARQKVMKAILAQGSPNTEADLLVIGNTGAALLDERDHLVTVEGSDAEHVATRLCISHRHLLMTGTLILSRSPCVVCTRRLLQSNVRRVVIVQRYLDTKNPVSVLACLHEPPPLTDQCFEIPTAAAAWSLLPDNLKTLDAYKEAFVRWTVSANHWEKLLRVEFRCKELFQERQRQKQALAEQKKAANPQETERKKLEAEEKRKVNDQKKMEAEERKKVKKAGEEKQNNTGGVKKTKTYDTTKRFAKA